MEREYIINYLKEVKRILDKRYRIQNNYNAGIRAIQVGNVIKNEAHFDDEELLSWAQNFEDIKVME